MTGTQLAPKIVRIGQVDDARALAAHLNGPGRTRPVAVISAPASRDTPYIDVEKIFDEVGDVVEVVTIPTGDVSRAFSAAMPPGTQVYGGAGRVYPVGTAWANDRRRAPLRFAFDDREGERSTQALIDDAVGMAAAAGLIGGTSTTSVLEVVGKVSNIVAGRAVVRTTTGSFVYVVGELMVPGLPIERLLTKGMDVRGGVDDARRLDVHGLLRGADALPYQPGEVVLARVDEVTEDAATLTLHPDLSVPVARTDVTMNDLDTLDTLMSASEVLRVRVDGCDPWRVRLWDIDDDEPTVAAFSLIDGGPPWLVEGLPELDAELFAPAEPEAEPIPRDEAPAALASTGPPAPPTSSPTPVPTKAAVPTPAIFDRKRRAAAASGPPPANVPAAVVPTEPPAPKPAPAPSPSPMAPANARLQADLAAAATRTRELKARVAGLLEENRQIVAHRNQLLDRNERLNEQLVRSRKTLRGTRTQSGMEIADEGPWFLDPAQQFDFEVRTAWARRIPAAQKGDLALAQYTLGPNFLRTVDELEGIKRTKIVEVVVEVLTGLAGQIASRELHQLRESEGGGARHRVRNDGAGCWRVSLQVKTASARRLHFWRIPDGTVELAAVAVHDDYIV